MSFHTWFCSGHSRILCPDRDTALRLAYGLGYRAFGPAKPSRFGLREPLFWAAGAISQRITYLLTTPTERPSFGASACYVQTLAEAQRMCPAYYAVNASDPPAKYVHRPWKPQAWM